MITTAKTKKQFVEAWNQNVEQLNDLANQTHNPLLKKAVIANINSLKKHIEAIATELQDSGIFN